MCCLSWYSSISGTVIQHTAIPFPLRVLSSEKRPREFPGNLQSMYSSLRLRASDRCTTHWLYQVTVWIDVGLMSPSVLLYPPLSGRFQLFPRHSFVVTSVLAKALVRGKRCACLGAPFEREDYVTFVLIGWIAPLVLRP